MESEPRKTTVIPVQLRYGDGSKAMKLHTIGGLLTSTQPAQKYCTILFSQVFDSSKNIQKSRINWLVYVVRRFINPNWLWIDLYTINLAATLLQTQPFWDVKWGQWMNLRLELPHDAATVARLYDRPGAEVWSQGVWYKIIWCFQEL